MRKQSGFTLIELMVVMAIVAILATAGISAYTGYVKKSRDTARAQIAGNLNTAVMSYAASNGGNPPASSEAFSDFLASTSEVFGGSSFNLSSGTLIQDPVGGKAVCLDAQEGATEPCAFHYTAYEDGTYAISYGVEHESSREGNFYKTTVSVLPDDGNPEIPIVNQTPIRKYGVYVGSAKYIGQEPTTQNQDNGYDTDEDGVDVLYTPPGGSVQSLIPVFRSVRVDVPVESGDGSTGGLDNGLTCNHDSECESRYCDGDTTICSLGGCINNSGICVPMPANFCTSSADCMAGHYCQITIGGGGGQCTLQTPVGGTCSILGGPVCVTGATCQCTTTGSGFFSTQTCTCQ